MSTNPHRPPPASNSKTTDLGPLIFENRGRTSKEVLIALGYSGFAVYSQIVLYSVLCLTAVVLILTKTLTLAEKPTPEEYRTRLYVGLAMFLSILGVMSWVFLRRPKKGKLAIHENGFRYRRRSLLWGEIRSIHAGRPLGRIESALVSTNRVLGKISPTNQAAAELSASAIDSALTLDLKDGTRHVMPVVSVYCEPEDIRRFLDVLTTRRPEIEVDPRLLTLTIKDS
jgi:hypothetical protein